MESIKYFIRGDYWHLIKERNGVYNILKADFALKLNIFLDRYHSIRIEKTQPQIPHDKYPELPYGKFANSFDWRLKQYSYKAIEKIIGGKQKLNILDIGSFNGWLSNCLAANGHNVVSVDYFLDEDYGLESHKYYKTSWLPLQMDLDRIDMFEKVFDVIIINHCLQFQPNPIEYSDSLKNLLKKNGSIILAGLPVFRNPQNKINAVEEFKQHYLNDYQFNIFLKETKGYIDVSDLEKLKNSGFRFNYYSQAFLKNLFAFLHPQLPFYCYGIRNNDATS